MKILQKIETVYYLIPIIVLIIIPFFVGEGWTSLIVEMLIMAIAASGANLMAGYTGMVSFGLAGFYGAGAYITALLVTKAGLPFGVAFVAGPVGAVLIALPIGWFCVRRTAIYFSMISLAFAQLMHAIAYTWYSFTGGDDGLVGITIPAFLSPLLSYYYFALIISIICLISMRMIVISPLGKTLQAIRENPDRSSFTGINVKRYQHAIFILSSFFLAVAGSLYCGFNRNVFPDYLFWIKTFDITIVYLLGGMFNFLGPTVGAFIYILLQKIIIRYTVYYPLLLGIIIVLITLFMPNGVAGFISESVSTTVRRFKGVLS